jgi:hypothetical protein
MDREGLGKLELLVNEYGLTGVLSGLSYICGEKSQHIAAHWQDEDLSNLWMGHAARLDRVAARIESRGNGRLGETKQ